MQQQQGLFITIEGTEGMGKSTVISSLAKFLRQQGRVVLVTREPGGTEIADKIRDIILAHYVESMQPETELLLYFAGRIQHVQTVVLPAINSGKVVISDRFTDASYAYQGGGREISLSKIRLLEEQFVNDLQPHLTLLLDAPIELGLQRIAARGEKDRIEQENLDFFQRVRVCYHQRARDYPERFHLIDATGSMAEVEQAALAIIECFVGGR